MEFLKFFEKMELSIFIFHFFFDEIKAPSFYYFFNPFPNDEKRVGRIEFKDVKKSPSSIPVGGEGETDGRRASGQIT